MVETDGKAIETREPSEAIGALHTLTMQHVQAAVQRIQELQEGLGAVALRDAKLDPADGWRFNLQTVRYERPRAVAPEPG